MNSTPRLLTAILKVADLERSAAWYKDMMGMSFAAMLDGRNRAVSLSHDGTCKLTLVETASQEETSRADMDSGYMVFATESLETDHALLKQRGADVTPILDEQGFRLFWITDPDGNRSVVLDFTAPPR